MAALSIDRFALAEALAAIMMLAEGEHSASNPNDKDQNDEDGDDRTISEPLD